MIRKGFGHLISKLITLGDFVCLNVAFLLLLYFYPDTFTDALSRRIVCLLLNLSYLPIAFFFRYVHNMRIVCIDRLLLIASESVFFSFLVFSACMACVKVYIDSTRLLLLFAFFFCILNLWWLLSNRILRYIRSRGYNFKRVVIVGAGPAGISLYNELQSDAGYGFRFLGFFDNDMSFEKFVPQFRGDIGAVGTFCLDNQVDEIYCALPDKENITFLWKQIERNSIPGQAGSVPLWIILWGALRQSLWQAGRSQLSRKAPRCSTRLSGQRKRAGHGAAA